MRWQLLDLIGIGDTSTRTARPVSKRRRNPAATSRLRAAAREHPIVVYGGNGKSIGESVRLAGRRLGIDLEWIPAEPHAGLASAQRLSSRLRRGKVSGVVLVNGIMSHKQVIPVVDGAKVGGVPFVLAGRAGSAQLARALEELEGLL